MICRLGARVASVNFEAWPRGSDTSEAKQRRDRAPIESSRGLRLRRPARVEYKPAGRALKRLIRIHRSLRRGLIESCNPSGDLESSATQ
jgi:hypothetical protein